MDQQLQEIREQQKASWNKFSSGWKKWDNLVTQFLQPMGDEIIDQLHLKASDAVLDIAGGTGEPGLTIASIVKCIAASLDAIHAIVAMTCAPRRASTRREGKTSARSSERRG